MSIKILHISDLHCSQGTDQNNKNLDHSIILMKEIDALIKKKNIEFDKLIVSGDLSNFGDVNSLLLARQWLLRELEIGNGEVTGLKLNSVKDKVHIIPGNHDAWNHPDSKKISIRVQKSLKNYNTAFPEWKFENTDDCLYDWIEGQNGESIFFTFLDSSLLGDPSETIENQNFINPIDRIAKGKLSYSQSEKLLELFDKGAMGNLEYPISSKKYIDGAKFKSALKILTTHHYLFEPDQFKKEPLLQMRHRDVVFKNIAMADFDMLLCGHKHCAAVDIHKIGKSFDDRATSRYLLNIFRRIIGIHSMPLQIKDTEKGQFFSKPFTAFISMLTKKYKEKLRQNDDVTPENNRILSRKIMDILEAGLDNPSILKKEIKSFINEYNYSKDVSINPDELKELIKTISIEFKSDDRKKIKAHLQAITKAINSLENRDFIQIMAGSACKSYSKEKLRSFNLYEISKDNDNYKLNCDTYFWDHNAQKFNESPKHITHIFSENRRPHVL